MARVYLGLGTNLGDRGDNLRRALRALRDIVTIDAISFVYETEPVGYREQPWFWNLVVRAEAGDEPDTLLARIQAVERDLGRTREFPNAPRVIDIDILLYDDRRIHTSSLEIPHPRMLERAFVLEPLSEIDPDLRHPVTGTRIRSHLGRAGSMERTRRLFPGNELIDSTSEGTER